MVQIAQKLEEAIFIKRENRFVGIIKLHGVQYKCHILNPGRMIKFLKPGARVLVENRSSPKRKLDYSLLYVKHPKSLILIDSQVPNEIIFEALKKDRIEPLSPVHKIKREVRYGQKNHSRIDFLLNDNIFLEVKATNYEENGVGYFPDAPTSRGKRHLQELIHLVRNNPKNQAVVLFLSQRMDIQKISPFDRIDPEFGNLLRNAKKIGVKVLAYGIQIKKDGKIAVLGKPLLVQI
ncbi:MAG: DNA/RNA nuclease SfsA [Candidatus Lokiarchaeota archaeon]|nr:DNA/RNA nuclease SfsA [Candidatus Harpocratesius repetitus]